jgi:hypothetical protein
MPTGAVHRVKKLLRPCRAGAALLLAAVVLLAAVPLSAQSPVSGTGSPQPAPVFVSNVGRQVLSKADLVLTGTLSRTVRQASNTFRRELLVESVLWGNTRKQEVVLVYTDPDTFIDGDSYVAVALKALDESGGAAYTLLGRRMMLDAARRDALKAYCLLESSTRPESERAAALRSAVMAQIAANDSASRMAGVELIYLVLHYPEVFAPDDYTALRAAANTASKGLAADIHLALKGLVETVYKRDAQIEIMAGKDEDRRLMALARLDQYFRDYSGAFTENDAGRCALIGAGGGPALLAGLERQRNRISDLVESRKIAAAAEDADTAGSSSWLAKELARRAERESFDGKPFAVPDKPESGAAEAPAPTEKPASGAAQ